MNEFSKGQYMGLPPRILDSDLINVVILLHRTNVFMELIDAECKIFGHTSRKDEDKRKFIKDNDKVSKKFKDALKKFESGGGPLWCRDVIAHNPISHGVNMGANNFQEAGYLPYRLEHKIYKEYFKEKKDGGEFEEARMVPFSTIARLSLEMLEIIDMVKSLKEYRPINIQDIEEVEKIVKSKTGR